MSPVRPVRLVRLVRRMTARPGLTLLEVLAAIFIMGIGMLALLTLFPLAALDMARALKDDRTATLAYNADAMARARDLRNDPTLATQLGRAPVLPSGYVAPDPNGPGYPVFVDPYYAITGSLQTLGAPGVVPHVFRRSPGYVTKIADADQWFQLLDDLSFDLNGNPLASVQRQAQYTLAYMLRRRQSSRPASTELTVIAYLNRPVSVPAPEEAYNVAAGNNLGDTELSLTWNSSQPVPELRAGNWVFDATYTRRGAYGLVNAQFYRVMSVNRAGNVVRIEVRPPLRYGGVNKVVVLEGAAEVFERGI